MPSSSPEQLLSDLFEKTYHYKPDAIEKMPAHGSDREYFRIRGDNMSVIGTYNPVPRENKAFLTFSHEFKNKELPVPKIFAEDTDNHIYIQEDLGDITLFSYLSEERAEHGFSERLIETYKKVISELPKFQVSGGNELDYSVAFPRHSFDERSMMWDLNYFKYYFLKLANIPFDEQDLENDFKTLVEYLLSAPQTYFLYRDFQSRNVMLKDGKPYFIDYQGGRQGALQYDIASLLFDGKADIPRDTREQLLEYYLDELEQLISVNREVFTAHYYGYVLIRILQAMGAYGFRGFYEQKTHFLQSVPYAIQNIEWFLNHITLPIEIPALKDALRKIVQSTFLRAYGSPSLTLTVHLSSFSYKKGMPRDSKGHGGGFVFDARSLTNPFRVEALREYNGDQQPIIDYLDEQQDMQEYLSHVKALLKQTVDNYKKRNFTDLMVSFGCTGGQHRSVYAAEQTAKYLEQEHGVIVELTHRDIPPPYNP